MHFNLQKYLDQKFPELKLRKPLFYSWPIGIRFELGPPGIPVYLDKHFTYNETYFESALERASAIFKFLFEAEDEVILIYQITRFNRNRIRKSNLCFKQLKNLNPSKIKYYKVKSLYAGTYIWPFWQRAVIELKAKQIQYKTLLKAISNQDFGSRKFQIEGEVYIINLKKNFIFHMYDDRGLDLIATETKDLKSIYKKFNAWILDYDRKNIDKIFKNI